jgi:hypothetical protein
MRYRVRTMLLVLAAAAVLAGGLRWRYDTLAAAHRRDLEIVQSTAYAKTECRWTAVTDVWPTQFVRVEHLWCEQCPELTRVAPRLGELSELKSIQIFARQILGHASLADDGRDDPVIGALRRHPTLEQLVVDATIRGAPLESGAPIATRRDLAMLEKLLPNLQIVWMEVN